jgi:eukaryotic-like serine/threonine-protein kinase
LSTISAQSKGTSSSQKVGRKTSLSSVLDNPSLPSPPGIVLQILEKASQPNCDPDEVLAILSKDSGLSAQVLKTVNSGLFGLSKSVGSLRQAVMVLGLRPLRSLVLSLALPAIRITDRDEMVVKYWQESVAGAVIARELARVLRRPDPEDDLMAGLLRDLGFLVFREAFPDEYRTLWKRCGAAWNARQCEEERERFGVDHAEISAVVLESWHLPAEIHQPVRFHHDPAGLTDAPKNLQQRAAMLYFASRLANVHTSLNGLGELLQFAQQHFAMNQAALVKFLSTIRPAIQEFATLLKVDIGQCPNYSGVIAAGCQELVRLSVEPKPTVALAGQSTKLGKPAPPEEGLDKTIAYPRPASSPPDAAHRTLPEFESGCLKQLPVGGAWLNGYEIRAILGRGAMGVVFKGFDPSLNRFVAIKMMTPERVVSSEAREWFKREARAAAAIQHENVITIYAVNEMNGLPYLVMEHLSGTSLQDRVDKEGPLPIADVIRFGRQIASGLHAAQGRGVIHRDIKPANILLGTQGGTVKITDFGLARVQNDVLKSQDGIWVGTPAYMAPEQFNAAHVDHRADLFSLGSLLYTLCAGRPPFEGKSIPALMVQVCNNAPAPLRTARPQVPAWLENLINKLQAKLPASRYQSAGDAVQEFDRH